MRTGLGIRYPVKSRSAFLVGCAGLSLIALWALAPGGTTATSIAEVHKPVALWAEGRTATAGHEARRACAEAASGRDVSPWPGAGLLGLRCGGSTDEPTLLLATDATQAAELERLSGSADGWALVHGDELLLRDSSDGMRVTALIELDPTTACTDGYRCRVAENETATWSEGVRTPLQGSGLFIEVAPEAAGGRFMTAAVPSGAALLLALFGTVGVVVLLVLGFRRSAARSRPSMETTFQRRWLLKFARRVGSIEDPDKVTAHLERALEASIPSARFRRHSLSDLEGDSLPAGVTPSDVETLHGALRPTGADPSSESNALSATGQHVAKVVRRGDRVVVLLGVPPTTGAILVGHGSQWSEGDLDLAQMFTETAAAAMRRAHLVRLAMLNERLASLGKVAAALSHEINNPLAYVTLNLEAIRKSVADEDVEALEDALGGVRRVTRIVQELGALSRGGARSEMQGADLVEVVTSALHIAEARRPDVLFRLAPSSSVPVTCDTFRVEQAIINVLTNAADAATGSTEPLVTVRVSHEGDFATVRICDTGKGIPADVRPRLFEPFYSSKGQAGTGLGLFLARSFAAMHGGDIEVEETGPNGTTMCVRILAAPSALLPKLPSARPVAKKPRVLLVDDEGSIIRAYRRVLRRHADVSATTDPSEGLDLALSSPFDLILLDFHMGPPNGAEIVDALSRGNPDAVPKIVIVTGSPDERLPAGIPVLTKPVEPTQLTTLLRVAVENSPPSGAPAA